MMNEEFPAVDAKRDIFHFCVVPTSLLTDRLIAQAYRPEILEAVKRIRLWGNTKSLGTMCGNKIRQPPAPQYSDCGIACLQTKDVEWILVSPNSNIETQFVSHEYASRYPSCIAHSGTILMNRKGAGSIGRSGVYLGNKPFATDDALYHIEIDPPNDPCFVATFLATWNGHRQLEQGINGSTGQLTINQSHLHMLVIPCPDIELQRAIGNKVRKAERLREMAGAQYCRLENQLAEILGHPPKTHAGQRAFWTGGALSPYRWNPSEYHPYSIDAELVLASRFSAVRLQDILKDGDRISGGATPLGASYANSGIGFLRVQNIQPNRLDLKDMVYIDEKTNDQLKRSRVRTHDIILTITGYPGTACCVQVDDLPLNINQHSVRFAVREDWDPFYLAAFLNSPWGKIQVKRRSIGGTREALDYPSIRSLLIPKIDIEKQQLIGGAASNYAQYLRDSKVLVHRAKENVDELLSGKLDRSEAIREGKHIESWLAANSSPRGGGSA